MNGLVDAPALRGYLPAARADFLAKPRGPFDVIGMRESSGRREETMHITLWILQVLLALVFLAHGLMFLWPPPDIAVQMDAMLPRPFQVFLGVAEVLAAVGLTLPGLTRILPGLVPAAAAGVMIVMVAATVLHLARSEFSSAAITFVLFLMAAFVAHGRWRRRPIAPRGW